MRAALAVGPFVIAAALLAVGGGLKAAQPAATARALAGLGLPRFSPALVRLAGGAEAGLAVLALVLGGPVPAGLVAASYLAFAGVVALALRRGLPISSCGCFGAQDSPPTLAHLVLNLGAAAAAGVAAAARAPRLATVMAAQPLAGLPFVVLVAVTAYLAWAAVTVLPAVSATANGGQR